MRALANLHRDFEQSIPFMHASRRKALWRAVCGLLRGGRLWLTGLGRDLPGNTSDKHRIKAADRLLGNRELQEQLPALYRARAAVLLARIPRPVLAVDWTGIDSPFWVLSAALCCQGRAVPIYSEVHHQRELATPHVHSRFLDVLATVLPAGCKPILVTDAGFYANWFAEVLRHKWDYVGRVRGRAHVDVAGRWVPPKALYAQAAEGPQDFGRVTLSRCYGLWVRLVLSAAPELKGRKRLTNRGSRRQTTTDHRCRGRATEPWLLATSLSGTAASVIGLYGLRMQIEELFRDEKNHRHGWALRDMRCRSTARIEVLLFIAALAFTLAQAVGRAAEELKLHHRFQANTVRDRRVLSWFLLGRLVLERAAEEVDAWRVAQAFARLRATASSLRPRDA